MTTVSSENNPVPLLACTQKRLSDDNLFPIKCANTPKIKCPELFFVSLIHVMFHEIYPAHPYLFLIIRGYTQNSCDHIHIYFFSRHLGMMWMSIQLDTWFSGCQSI
jgi:hypothetical protein